MGKRKLAAAILLAGFLLGVKDGYVALWKDGKADPVRVFPYSVSALPKADQAALEQGIHIDSASDLTQLLEDYLS